ncbi:MAG TPA: uridine kinase [Bdellovibrionales bacterium]|nr:MAG: uridine kinase [Bdellovibrionales bacterium GWB1_52_6]OFZ04928.1 MAG: uridine kinase [Bdellovibrionales bacterium GWA1_52_35]OFZ35651.1 MAG: uridine kinase [Bdellovibrionales bacterium GWC1_52_8]HAR43149.1 uridine kinase [Bdellovibrionales bacterium]HCM38864.1 uridine kinase [Bdellovibrionales bacterium]
MFLVGIAGGSGSGKTTFAHKVIKRVSDPTVVLLHQDSYYLPGLPSHLRVHGEPNFDHPDAFDWSLLKDHLSRLKAGEQVAAPIYDFRTSRRLPETQVIGPCKTILMEGIYTLWDAEIRNLFDVKIYLHVESDIRFIRRLHRDVRERNRTLDSIIRQYYDTVRPMHHEFLEHTKQYADLVVGEETDIAAEVVAAQVKQMASSFHGIGPFATDRGPTGE